MPALRNIKLALAATAFLTLSSSLTLAGSNMERVDIVKEGIDMKPIYVDANANGYTGSENVAHKYLVRVYAKAKGLNRVYKVSIFGFGAAVLFDKHVGKSEGWPVYAKSHEIFAKPSSMGWVTTPKTACDNLMKKKIAGGMSKADVLKSEQKTTALALIGFSAHADSKANNKKNKHRTHDGIVSHNDNTAYQVSVVCRAGL